MARMKHINFREIAGAGTVELGCLDDRYRLPVFSREQEFCAYPLRGNKFPSGSGFSSSYSTIIGVRSQSLWRQCFKPNYLHIFLGGSTTYLKPNKIHNQLD